MAAIHSSYAKLSAPPGLVLSGPLRKVQGFRVKKAVLCMWTCCVSVCTLVCMGCPGQWLTPEETCSWKSLSMVHRPLPASSLGDTALLCGRPVWSRAFADPPAIAAAWSCVTGPTVPQTAGKASDRSDKKGLCGKPRAVGTRRPAEVGQGKAQRAVLEDRGSPRLQGRVKESIFLTAAASFQKAHRTIHVAMETSEAFSQVQQVFDADCSAR
ncbi:hypothetical protein E5288_WYG005094 [Bos mutus]|uniref:Uncharacterized protein n=1 Tax=Bos mutus TaxID=72004 RepID=A0A6B0S836_9CETA|nr:hypothetical protein [Bos mutus]